MINWNIASHPVNWLKIGLMAAFFLFAFEYLAKVVNPPEPAPDIMP